MGRPIGYSLLQTSEHSDTLYIGSRSSDAYGRLYDKGAESKAEAYAGCWRYEVEYKRKPALAKARALWSSPDTEAAIQGDCYRWFSDRRVLPCFRPGAAVVGGEVPTEVADDERWLAWVRRCVQPRARELVKRYGWRYVAETCAGGIVSIEEWLSLTTGVEFELEVTDIG